MKVFIYFNLIVTLLFSLNSYSQKLSESPFLIQRSNYLTFTPISQNITINSGQSWISEVDVRAFGDSPDPLFYNVSILSLDDAGFINFNANPGIINVGQENIITFRFQQDVNTTTTSQYRFNINWDNDNSGSGFNQEIIINITYNPSDGDTNDSCVEEPPNNLYTSFIGFNEINNPERTFASAEITREFTNNTARDFWYTEIRERGVSGWSRADFSNRITKTYNDLKENQVYEWRASSCQNGSDPSPIYSFRTLGSCSTTTFVSSNIPSRASDARTGRTLLEATNVIFDNASAFYSSGQSVILKPGFKASVGSIFKAYIEDCSSYPSPGRSVVDVENNELDIKEIEVNIYPNPSLGLFSIDNNDLEIVDWEVYDQFGVSQLKNRSVIGKTISVDLTSKRTGIYFVRLMLKSGEIVSKSIIKK